MIDSRQDCDRSASLSDEALADLLELIASKLKTGANVSLDEIVAQHPEQDAEIRALYPTVAAMVQMAGDSASHSARSQNSLLEASSVIARPHRHRLGDFQLIREVGRGGMGVVYEAEQISLGRRVAIKVLPFAAMLDDRLLKRFKNEARSAATLEHPHIVSVHSIGCERGIHYFAMQFVDGLTLEEVIHRLKAVVAQEPASDREIDAYQQNLDPSDLTVIGDTVKEPRQSKRNDDSWLPGDAWESSRRTLPIPPACSPAHPEDVTASLGTGKSLYERIAQLATQAADAIEHAHQQRIIHRDIKPSNLMLDDQGQIWVTDFGLATTHGDSNLTLVGDRLGTLRYSSPEQARGGVIDHRTDIYSLGISLYELLALTPAFETQDRQELMGQILNKEPRRLRQIRRDIPADLEVIVHKACAKDPQERYQTARELADDLRRYLSHQPIKAKPPAIWESAAKWIRRRPGVALLALAACVALVAVSIALSVYTVQLRLAHARLAEMYEESLTRESQLHRSVQYPSSIRLAAAAIEQRDHSTASLALAACVPSKPGMSDPCGFEWYLLQERIRPPKLQWELKGAGAPMFSAAVSPDGKYAATGDNTGLVCLWDLENGSRVRSWRPFTGETLVSFSPKGTWLAAASDHKDGRVVLWDLKNFKEAANFVAHDGTTYAVAFNADETLLATGGREQIIKLWKLSDVTATNEAKGPLRPTPVWQAQPGCVIYDLHFSPDGSWLISAEKQSRLRIWNTADGSVRSTICESNDDDSFQACSLLSQGRICAAGGYSNVLHFFDVASRREIAALDCRDGIYDIAVSPDEKQVAAVCDDGSVSLWRFDGPQQLKTERICFVAHQGRIREAAFSPNGRSLITAGDDGVARVWSTSSVPAPEISFSDLQAPGGFSQLRSNSKGDLLAALGFDGKVRVLEPRTAEIRQELSSPEPLSNICFDAQGRWLAASTRQEVFVRRTSDWMLDCTLKPKVQIEGIAFGAGDSLLVLSSAGEDLGRLDEWQLPAGDPKRGLKLEGVSPRAAVCSPSGNRLAVSTTSDKLLLIDLQKFESRTIRLPVYPTPNLVFSSDEKRLVAADNGNTICLLDVGKASVVSYHHLTASEISGLAFTADQRLLAISDHQQKCVHFWDPELTRLLFSLDAMSFKPHGAILSSDGRFLYAATWVPNQQKQCGLLKWDLKPSARE